MVNERLSRYFGTRLKSYIFFRETPFLDRSHPERFFKFSNIFLTGRERLQNGVYKLSESHVFCFFFTQKHVRKCHWTRDLVTYWVLHFLTCFFVESIALWLCHFERLTLLWIWALVTFSDVVSLTLSHMFLCGIDCALTTALWNPFGDIKIVWHFLTCFCVGFDEDFCNLLNCNSEAFQAC